MRHRRDGYSLVELLVVMAIFAALVGLALPAINRAGGFLGDDPDLAARELYATLRAARVYAGTYRVDTAVVYGLRSGKLDGTGPDVLYIDSYGIARQLNPDEREAIGVPRDNEGAFMMVQNREASFRKLPENSCILSIDNNYDPTVGIAADGTAREGFQFIELYTDGGFVPPIVTLPGGGDLFPAHVFTAAGFMEPQSSPVARFTINVAVSPEASPDERYTILPGDEDETGTVLPEGQLKVPVRIELFRTTGRVKMTS